MDAMQGGDTVIKMPTPKKVAAIHDLSGFGRCSLTVIIPVMSAMGIQVCPVPTAVLATHTGGFGEVIMKDLTDFIPAALGKYKELGIEFDAVYSGFLASAEQVSHCLDFFKSYPDSLKVVDPVMGDHGRLYSTYTGALCAKMSELAKVADVITPNLTEAAILLGEEYPSALTDDMAKDWLGRLREFAETVVITGVFMTDGRIVNIGADKSGCWSVDCDYVPESYPGTGDLFTSVLTASLLKNDRLPVAVKRAAEFVQAAVKNTFNGGKSKEPPRNGINFEEVLPALFSNKNFL